MSDNIEVVPSTATNAVSVAMDECYINGLYPKVQRVKAGWGDDGTYYDPQPDYPLPVSDGYSFTACYVVTTVGPTASTLSLRNYPALAMFINNAHWSPAYDLGASIYIGTSTMGALWTGSIAAGMRLYLIPTTASAPFTLTSGTGGSVVALPGLDSKIRSWVLRTDASANGGAFDWNIYA